MDISIITVNKNNAVGLKKTIESVACQDFQSYEFIAIDGAFTDGSKNIIQPVEKGFFGQCRYAFCEKRQE